MKKIILILISIFVSFLYGKPLAQPPVYGLSIDDELNMAEDTLSYMMLYDINGDSVKEMFYSNGRNLHIYDLVSGLPATDSIEYENEFVYTIHYSEEDSITYIYSAEYIGGFSDSIILKVVYLPLNNMANRDSFYVNAEWQPSTSCLEYFLRLASISIFDIGTDGIPEVVLNWGSGRTCDFQHHFETLGFMTACNFEGDIVVDVTEIINTLECDKFGFGGRWYFVVWQNRIYWFSFGGYNEYSEGAAVYIYDDMLRRINYEPVTFDWANFKLLKNIYGIFLGMLLVSDSWVGNYSAPFFFEGSAHNMPANALGCYFKHNYFQYVLTGVQDSYFELRDMDLNLLAFIWGPPIEIFDVDPVDVDLDGTDELLCKTDSGFVLYRLNTATEIAGEEEILPSDFDISAYPNPFNSQLNLAVSGFENEKAEIRIYDIGGRLVRSYPAANGTIQWDGTDYAGAALSSGVYFITARTSEKSASTKVLLLK
jgi:hypothetical protein